MKRLLNTAVMFGCLALAGLAAPAQALPRDCIDVCSCTTGCNVLCWDAGVTRCGVAGYACIDNCRGSAQVAQQQAQPEYTHGCSEAKTQAPTQS